MEGLGLNCVVHHRASKLFYKCCSVKCQATANISITEPLSHSKCACQFSWVVWGVLKITDGVKLSEATAGLLWDVSVTSPVDWPALNSPGHGRIWAPHTQREVKVALIHHFWKGSTGELRATLECTERFVLSTFPGLTLVLFHRTSQNKSTAEPQPQSRGEVFPKDFLLDKRIPRWCFPRWRMLRYFLFHSSLWLSPTFGKSCSFLLGTC